MRGFVMKWRLDWHAPMYDEKTRVVTSTFFHPDSGFSAVEVGKIVMLNRQDSIDFDHLTITRIQ